jgi:hypothetical protein
MKNMNMKNEMIPLTVANTLDQSQKQRVEVPQNASLKQAIQDMKLAPKGQFDIYDATGSVISIVTQPRIVTRPFMSVLPK